MIWRLLILIMFAWPVAAEDLPMDSAPPQGNPESGALAYRSLCADCHASAPRLLERLGLTDTAARAVFLDEALRQHHPPGDALRADIVAWMATL